MSKYYYLVAGLPELTLEDSKLSYTVAVSYTHLGYRRQLHGDVMLIPKASLSSDWSLQPDSMKLDALVIAHQPRRGEYVPGPCTHRPSSHESRGYLKCATARSAIG